MKKVLFIAMLLLIVLMISACDEESERDTPDFNENISDDFATDSFTVVWKLEDNIQNDEEIDEDKITSYTDKYIMNEEKFESLNGYEQGVAMKASEMVSKYLDGKYEDEDLFQEDNDEFYNILENGDDIFIKDTNTEQVNETEEENQEAYVEPTEQEKIISDLSSLFDEKKAFDAGSYTKGSIPEGEYAFSTFEGSGGYYSEEDLNGNIIANENFNSFGYIKVHEAGNIQTDGVLVDVDVLDDLNVSGAKDIYEKINDVEDYKQSGWYKVGEDINSGEYTIKSYGSGYVGVMTGPVGDNEIVTNENFNGEYAVNIKEGQYLTVSNGEIVE